MFVTQVPQHVDAANLAKYRPIYRRPKPKLITNKPPSPPTRVIFLHANLGRVFEYSWESELGNVTLYSHVWFAILKNILK